MCVAEAVADDRLRADRSRGPNLQGTGRLVGGKGCTAGGGGDVSIIGFEQVLDIFIGGDKCLDAWGKRAVAEVL